MIEHLSWLHVSDFHFEEGSDQFSQSVAAEALLNDLRVRLQNRRHLDFVVVTGDIAYSGRKAEYDRASEFFHELATTTGVKPDRFYFAPGNHDVDRGRARLAFNGAHAVLTTQAAVDRLLGDYEEIAQLLERQREFWDFERSFTVGQRREFTDDRLAYVAPLDIGGVRLCIVSLNSAWMSGAEHEEHELLIGERQIINVLSLAKAHEPRLTIALAHHPLDWLREWDQAACHQRLLPQLDILHRGHLHSPLVSLGSTPESPCLYVAAGAGHVTRFYENSYNIIDLSLGNGSCTVRPFRYVPSDRRFGAGDSYGAHVSLRGQLPGTPEELAFEIARRAPRAAGREHYLAALITGAQGEVPILCAGKPVFVTIQAARTMSAPEDLECVERFLCLGNVLRLYDSGVSLGERVYDQEGTLTAFAERLGTIALEHAGTDVELANREATAKSVLAGASAASRPHTRAFLRELRNEQDWASLEIQAERHAASDDAALAFEARAALVEALANSDEAPKRLRAAEIARQLHSEHPGDQSVCLLCVAANEAADAEANACAVMLEALAAWPASELVREHAKGLALRTGNVQVRSALEGRAHDKEQCR